MSKPPPNAHKFYMVKMYKNQPFATIVESLEEKTGKKIVSFSFDGYPVNNDATPQELIDELDLVQEDLINIVYS